MTNPLIEYWGRRRSLKIILQTEVTECGLACLAMLANFHGHDFTLGSLRMRYPVSTRGLNLSHIVKMAEDLGFDASAYKVELDHLEDLTTPCILHWDLNHFVICEKVTRHGAVIFDPAKGIDFCTLKELSKHFTGVALELKTRQDFKPIQEKRSINLWQLSSQVIGVGHSFTMIGVVSCLMLIMTMLLPYMSILLMDEVVPTRDLSLLHLMAIGFSVIVVFDTIARFMRDYLVLHVGTQFTQQFSRNLIKHLLRLPLAFFEKRHVGDILSRLESLEFIKHVLSEELVATLIDGVIALTTVGLMLTFSPHLTGVVMVSVVIYGIVRVGVYRVYRRASEERLNARGREESNLLESLRSMQSIKLYGGERVRLSTWMAHFTKAINANIRAQTASLTGGALNHLIFGIEDILILWMGGMAVLEEQITVGVFVAFLSYKSQFVQVVSLFINRAFDFGMLTLHLERLSDIVLQTPEPEERGHHLLRFDGDLKAVGLTYRYSPQEPYIFLNLDLEVGSGESVAIVGPSGCGKTTLVKVLLGLLEPERGEIFIDQHNIKNVRTDYRQQIATVMQDDRLITGSIAENIAFFDPNPDLDRIMECAELASIHDEILAMTMGYQSVVSDLGSSLSGGQKQRILLARALYRRPSIMFLDEATSALDVTRERAINDAIKDLRITRIIIAHRPETIASAGRILLLKDKKLVAATLDEIVGLDAA
jgi:ATP-binding cassette subfamily B protein RaxB